MDKDMSCDNYSEKELDLYDLWLTLKKRWLVILIFTVVAAGLAFFYSSVSRKVYSVHNILVANLMQEWGFIGQGEMAAAVSVLDKINKLNDIEKNRISALLRMTEHDLEVIKNISATEIKGSTSVWIDIDTYDRKTGVALMESLPGFILSTPSVADKMNTTLGLMKKNREALKSIIDNPTRNLKLTNGTVVYLPSIDLYSLQDKYNQLNMMIEKAEKGTLLSLAWKTEQPKVPTRPKKAKIMIIGILAGCFLGVLSAFTLEWHETAKRNHLKRLS